jgi:putative heme transporter
MVRRVGGYVGGTVLVLAARGLVSGVALLHLGVPYFVPLAVLGALVGLVPLLGSAVGAALLGAVTLGTAGLHAALVVVAVYLGFVQLEAHVLDPLVQGHTVDMNPLVITVVVLLGTALAGAFGALLALPIAAIVQVALEDVRARHAERPPPGPEVLHEAHAEDAHVQEAQHEQGPLPPVH